MAKMTITPSGQAHSITITVTHTWPQRVQVVGYQSDDEFEFLKNFVKDDFATIKFGDSEGLFKIESTEIDENDEIINIRFTRYPPN